MQSHGNANAPQYYCQPAELRRSTHGAQVINSSENMGKENVDSLPKRGVADEIRELAAADARLERRALRDLPIIANTEPKRGPGRPRKNETDVFNNSHLPVRSARRVSSLRPSSRTQELPLSTPCHSDQSSARSCIY